MKVGIGLGSNLGNRSDHLDRAVAALRLIGQNLRVSGWVESDPVDCPPGSPPFLNGAAVMDWQGEPLTLLRTLQSLEAEAGRAPEHARTRNAPRPLDLDILFIEGVVYDTKELTLPHPRLCERWFVVKPLAELVPDFSPIPGGDCLATLAARFSGEPKT